MIEGGSLVYCYLLLTELLRSAMMTSSFLRPLSFDPWGFPQQLLWRRRNPECRKEQGS